jgi:hypothetical protein
LKLDILRRQLDECVIMDGELNSVWRSVIIDSMRKADVAMAKHMVMPKLDEPTAWQDTGPRQFYDGLAHVNHMAAMADIDNDNALSLIESLTALIEEFGSPFVDAVKDMALTGKTPLPVAVELVKALGNVEHRPSQDRRLTTLVEALDHKSVRVRDGAVSGLAALGDAHAIPYLQRAMNKERNTELRRDMQSALRLI